MVGLAVVSSFETPVARASIPLIQKKDNLIQSNAIVNQINMLTKELDLLIFLASHSDQVFTIRQIYANITDEPFVETYKSLESCLYRLRKKIGTDLLYGSI